MSTGRAYFRSENLIVTVLADDDDSGLPDVCPSSTCCAPPTEDTCDLSLLRPGCFGAPPMGDDQLQGLIHVMRETLGAEKRGVDIVLCPHGKKGTSERWKKLLTNELGPPVRRVWAPGSRAK